MRVFDGRLGVAFSQAYVAASVEESAFGEWPSAFFRGQENGLLGAVKSGFLYLTVGASNDGEVGLTVDVVEIEPPLDDSWEECVEASFSPTAGVVSVVDWGNTLVCEIPLPEETYRVRYAARGMDCGYAGTDVYGLWFWPSTARADAIVRQTSQRAAYWHGETARVNRIRPEGVEDW